MQANFFSLALRRSFMLLSLSIAASGCTNTVHLFQSPGAGNKQVAAVQQKKPTEKLLRIPLQCQQHVLTPAVFKLVQRKLRVFESSPAYSNIPATIDWQTVRFQTAPARFPHETVPAIYSDVIEDITVLRRRIEVVGKPAKYKTINKPITTQEAYATWKPGCANKEPLRCITQIPAKKQVIKQTFIDMPARVMQVERPERTLKLKRKVLVTPGQGYGKPIPAQYKAVKIGRVSKVWQLIAKRQPDRFANIPTRVKVRPERLQPTPALCYNQATKPALTLIQQRLQHHGYPVTSSGQPDQQTLQAIVQFQQANQLPIGAITIETLRGLAANAS